MKWASPAAPPTPWCSCTTAASGKKARRASCSRRGRRPNSKVSSALSLSRMTSALTGAPLPWIITLRRRNRIMSKQRIGYIGVGLMGHGAAKNMLQQGHPLTIMGHRNRVPVDDLVALGAREAKTPAEAARASEVVLVGLPSTAEVEHAMYAA